MLEWADNIKQAIYKHGVVGRGGKQVFAYEVDGMGNYKVMDDANLPSLLSLSYLKFVDINDELYKNTREFVLSERDYYFFAFG